MNQPIAPETARHVLWLHGADGGCQPGVFMTRLIATICAADRIHTEMLRTIYPALVAAIAMAGTDPDGIATLQNIAAADEEAAA